MSLLVEKQTNKKHPVIIFNSIPKWYLQQNLLNRAACIANFERILGSVIHVSEGGVKANHNVTSSPSLADNDSKLLKNSEGNRDGEWIFCRRKVADIALFLQVTRIRKIRKNREANLTSRLLLKTGRSQNNKPWNTKSTNHASQTMTFWTHASKHVFPKRSAKMIDGTEKPKIPLKFAKRTPLYNEFHYKHSVFSQLHVCERA